MRCLVPYLLAFVISSHNPCYVLDVGNRRTVRGLLLCGGHTHTDEAGKALLALHEPPDGASGTGEPNSLLVAGPGAHVPLTLATDVSGVIAAAPLVPDAIGQVFNLWDDSGWTMRDFIAMVRAVRAAKAGTADFTADFTAELGADADVDGALRGRDRGERRTATASSAVNKARCVFQLRAFPSSLPLAVARVVAATAMELPHSAVPTVTLEAVQQQWADRPFVRRPAAGSVPWSSRTLHARSDGRLHSPTLVCFPTRHAHDHTH